uniref:EthD domain-containing protein n=1 Tax=Rhodococcus sp. NS1 TaxID=402236 RepID=A0A097SPU0_9NOCA|nr:hypothetical protein LRS1606.105 [Rhodococcus sp. NS1]
MITFWLFSRPRPDMSQEQFDYEWGVIHTSLMVTTPSVMRNFKRYIQHRRIAQAPREVATLVPSSPEDWYSASAHDLEDFTQLRDDIFGGPEYPRRMFGHKFGDTAFVIELTSPDVVHEESAFERSKGGVKLINVLKRKEGITQEQFTRAWREGYADRFLEAASNSGVVVQRYVQNTQLPLEAETFAGTLFEAGGVQNYAGIEEIWVDDLDSLQALGTDLCRSALNAALGEFVDIAASFSLVAVERVVWDQTLGSPKPSILDPNSFEARMVAAERPNNAWNTIV